MKELRALNKYFYRYKKDLIIGTICVTLACVFAIIPAQIVRHAFDLVADTIGVYNLYKGFDSQQAVYVLFKNAILFYGGLIILMALIRGFFLFLQRQTIIVMSRRIEYDLKNDIYVHYQELPMSFYKRNNTGDLMARISEDVSHVRMYVGPAIMYSITTVVTFIVVISYMLTINVKLTLFSLMPLPLLAIGIYYVSRIVNRQSTRIQESLSGITTFVQEAFSGIRVVKAFVREKDFEQRFLLSSNTYRKESLGLTKVNAMFFPLIVGLIGLSTILTVYVGGIEVMNGSITAGNIAEFIIYVNMLTWPVASLGWVTSLIQRASASQARINEFLDTKTKIDSEKNLKDSISGSIEFRNVTFDYPDSGIRALDGVSFKVSAGETLAVLGSTGSGKSTIANLICRMYDTSGGSILVDEKDIKDYEPQHLRSHIGYVPQEVFLFSDTIRNNIAFGFNEGDYDEDQIIKAAKDSDLLDNIEGFPEGFDTRVGERGITLSGGQKQRVSIARAVIRSPKVLVLDDALSAVDTKTEHTILNSMAKIMEGRTSVIISHRASSVKLADRIIVLDEGKVLEEGTHNELMALGGAYKELYEKQLKSEETVS